MQMLCKTQPLEIDRLQGIENAFCIAGHGKIVERHYISQNGCYRQSDGSKYPGNTFAQLMPHKSQKQEHAKRK